MTTLTLLIALGCSPQNAADFAAHIDRYAAEWGVPSQVAAAVLYSESTCRKNARGRRGEVGGWQLKRGSITTGKAYYTDAQLMSPRLSTWLALRRLAHAREACASEVVPRYGPELWVGGYAGFRCGPSPYGKRIVGRLERALRKVSHGEKADSSGIPEVLD